MLLKYIAFSSTPAIKQTRSVYTTKEPTWALIWIMQDGRDVPYVMDTGQLLEYTQIVIENNCRKLMRQQQR